MRPTQLVRQFDLQCCFLMHNLPNHIGYTTLFIVTILYFGLGTLVIRQVKGVK
ncbi:MAG: hypothetical protein ACJ795_20715 [Ktedonobacteraceae bacterium]